MGAVSILPFRLVSRLPHLGQRTRRFPHARASYPVVYWITTRNPASDLGRALIGPTQLDAVEIGALTRDFGKWTQYPLMRTTLTGSNLGFHPRESPGATAARPFPPGSFTVAPPSAGIKTIRATTRRLWLAWIGAASSGRGAPKRSSRRFGVSDETTDAGPHRRTSVRLMASPATGRCGAGSILSRRRSNLRSLKVRRSGETRTAGGPNPGPEADRCRTPRRHLLRAPSSSFSSQGVTKTSSRQRKGGLNQVDSRPL